MRTIAEIVTCDRCEEQIYAGADRGFDGAAMITITVRYDSDKLRTALRLAQPQHRRSNTLEHLCPVCEQIVASHVSAIFGVPIEEQDRLKAGAKK